MQSFYQENEVPPWANIHQGGVARSSWDDAFVTELN